MKLNTISQRYAQAWMAIAYLASWGTGLENVRLLGVMPSGRSES